MRLRLLFIVLPLLALVGTALAEKTVTKQSSLGGNVEETVYEEGDNEYRYEKKRVHFDDSGDKIMDEHFILANDYNDLGVKKTVKSYFKGGGLKAVEVVFREEKAMVVGYDRIVLIFNQAGNRRRMTVHFKDDHKDKQIYSRSNSYYDLSGVKTRTITYFTKRLTATTGYHRIIEQYDQKGNKISEKIFDRDGNVY